MSALKDLLGDAYKEGMTHEEIDAVLAGKNLADLSSGKYVSKEKADREKAEALKALQDEAGKKKTADDEATQKLNERITALENEKAKLEYSKKLSALGIDEKYLAYVQSQVPMDENFDKNIEQFKKDNPAFCTPQDQGQGVGFTKFGGQQGKATDDEGTLLDAIGDFYNDKK